MTANTPWAKRVGTPIPSLTFHFYRYYQLADVDTTLLMFLHLAERKTALYNK